MNYSSLSDETLFLLISRAHAGALDELYNRYSRMVFGLALSLVGDRATAEEVTLDVFTRVWEKADTYRANRAKVSTWLMTVTRHRAIDVLRRQGARPEHNSISWAQVSGSALSAGSNPEQATERLIRQEQVRAAVAQLPEEQRRVLGLAYFAGYTHRQIAQALDQPLGTVKTRIRLAMQKLRQMLADD